MQMRIQEIMIDCRDPAALSRFWADLMSCRQGDANDDLALVEGQPVRLMFQRVPESKRVKNRLHLDVQVSDAEEACGRALDLGARHAGHRQIDDDGDGFVVMLDPEGNEFCFVVDNSGGWEQLAIDALDRDADQIKGVRRA